MQFGLSESQEFLKDSARKFFAGECPSSEMRRLMETDTAYDPALWSKLTDQGYTGIIFPEAYGGVGLGKVELMLLMEEAGRALLPGPFFSTVVLAGSVLDAVASPAHKQKYLAPICRGEARSTVAILEANASWKLSDVQLTATDGKLTGEKLFVSDAAVAEFIIVVARNGIFVVSAKAPGLKISPMSSMDLTRKLYVVELNNTSAEEIGATTHPRTRLRRRHRRARRRTGRWHATHPRHHRRICQDAQTIRQTHWHIPSRPAPVRGHVFGNRKFPLRGVLCRMGARGKFPGCVNRRFHRQNVRE